MNIMNLGLNDWVTCPFNPVHRMKYSKFHNHFVKCRAQHPEDRRKPCPYNYSELIEPDNWDEHLINCAYRVLYVTNCRQSNELHYYDAPCHIKFGPSNRSIRYKLEETDSVSSNESESEEEIDSISTIEKNCVPTESNIEEHIERISITDAKNKQEIQPDGVNPSCVEVGKCSNEKPIVFRLEKKGFGRGAFFRKRMSSNDA